LRIASGDRNQQDWSKHMKRQPFKGKVRIFDNSSLRKIMRAARRGKIPPERQVLIDTAVKRASERRAAYLNSCPVKRAWRSSATA
jgi:hypothetical protein